MAEAAIAAIATPPGIGGVAIIRISGENAHGIGQALTGKNLTPRHAHFAHVKSVQGQVIDEAVAIYFKAPNSFTGEDVVEIQGHGGVAIANAILTAALDSGARLAEPGEFTRRAFLNDKLDLAQAEAVADLIAARSQSAMQAAARSLQGEFSRAVNNLADEILRLRVYIEAALDFPEEEIDFLSEGDIEGRLMRWGEELAQLLAASQQGKLLNEGIDLVLAGKPNAGKSSLLNALSGEDRAIVTEQAGTTRDIVRDSLVIDGIPVNVLDTAGLRDSQDIVEQEGIRRSRQAIAQADIIALLIAGDDIESEAELRAEIAAAAPETPLLVLYNKADITNDSVQKAHTGGIWLSAKTGSNIEAVKTAIAQLAGKTDSESPFIARERHIRALKNAQSHYHQALTQLQSHRAGELVAEDLRQAHDSLGEITGKIRADDLLGEIFSGFCIGK